MNKFIFANQLRGIAALLVVMTHYFGTFFAEQPLVATKTMSPELGFRPPQWVHAFELPYQGPFGVAIFFLISGFVIPFSLRKASSAGFLVHRAFRVLPTYISCLTFGMLAVYLSASYWQQPFTITLRSFLANAFLVHNVLGLPTLDSVNWTLAIEMKFYLLAALVPVLFLRANALWLAAFLAGALALTASPPWLVARFVPAHVQVLMELNYIVFMVTGTQFHHHVTGRITTRQLWLRVLAIVAVFSGTWSLGPQQGQFPAVTVFYYCAVAVFGVCYALRERFRPVRVLDFLADISYPLYCLHSLFGYCTLKWLMAQGLPFGAAVLLTLTSALALAWLVHRTIEVPSNRLGKRLGERLPPRAPLAVGAHG